MFKPKNVGNENGQFDQSEHRQKDSWHSEDEPMDDSLPADNSAISKFDNESPIGTNFIKEEAKSNEIKKKVSIAE